MKNEQNICKECGTLYPENEVICNACGSAKTE